MARATPTSRGTSHEAPLSGVKPRLTKGSQKRLSWAATVKSAASELATQPCGPPPDGADHGKLHFEEQRDDAVGLERRATLDGAGAWLLARGVRRHPVRARAEVRPGAGEQDGAQRVVGRGRLEGLDDAPHGGDVERALALGAVDDDAQHAAVALHQDAASCAIAHAVSCAIAHRCRSWSGLTSIPLPTRVEISRC